MDSNGALNLASSPSPRDQMSSLSPVSMVASADTSRSPPRTGQTFGVEVCVVCGDRASGKIIRVGYVKSILFTMSFADGNCLLPNYVV